MIRDGTTCNLVASMHILASLIVIFGALIVLVLGLASVVHDLLDRAPLESPLVQSEDLKRESSPEAAVGSQT